MLEPEASDRPCAEAVMNALENGAFGRRPSRRTIRRGVVFGATALLIGVATWGVLHWERAPTLDPATGLHFTARYFADDTTVEIADDDGNILRKVRMGRRLDLAEFGDQARRQVAFGDFNGDTWVDAAVVQRRDPRNGPLVLYLRQPDGSLKPAAEHTANLEYRYEEQVFTDFSINDIITADLDGDGRSELILLEASSPYYSSAVRVIDWQNESFFTLWHPGILMNVQTADRDDDGRPEIYLGGTCNFLTPPESNTSAPVFLAVEADWSHKGQVLDLFATGRKLASSTAPGIRVHYASWARIDLPQYRTAWQKVLVQQRINSNRSHFLSLVVSLQDRSTRAPGTGVRLGIRNALIGFDLQQIDAQWEPTVARSLGIDPNTPEMQALLQPRYWNGSTWQETLVSMPDAESGAGP